MAKSSIIITSANTSGKTMQKTLTDINPNASNEQLATFGQMLNGLSNNTYGKTEKVTKVNCDAEEGGGKTQPTFFLSHNGAEPATEFGYLLPNDILSKQLVYNGDATVISYSSDKKGVLLDIGTISSSITAVTFYGMGQLGESTAHVTIYAPETDNYQAATYSVEVLTKNS